MSSTRDKTLKKNFHYEGVVKKKTNHILYQDIFLSEYDLKGEKLPELEMLDKKRYNKTKQKTNKSGTMAKHQRLNNPIGKETSFKRGTYNKYQTNTTYVTKKTKIESYNDKSKKNSKFKQFSSSQRNNKPGQYTSKTFENKKKILGKNNYIGQNRNERSQVINKSSINGKSQSINRNEQNMNKERNMNTNIINNGQNFNLMQNPNLDNYSFFRQNIPSEWGMNFNRYGLKTLNQSKNLPFYPIGQENKYQTQTEKRVICHICGKPKRPKQNERILSLDQGEKLISRDIIGEQSPQGDYIIKNNRESELNKPIESLFQLKDQGRETQERFQQNLLPLKGNFCPRHGYSYV